MGRLSLSLSLSLSVGWENISDQKLEGFKVLKNRHFFLIQERLNKLIYSINTMYDNKMQHLTACKISVSLSFGSASKME